MEKTTAEADLKTKLTAIRSLGGKQREVDAAIARNILHEELGQFSNPQRVYQLDEATRDRLIAHGRQDAAHALLAIGSVELNVAKLNRKLTLVIVLLVILIGLMAYALLG
ncbi:hypothetical protein [Rhizobium ruizarguesonis]|uniref:hypothetical protein n=1 Tax=Rhizobium ruizarguesonis TaxID=2081791 RepID=UPI00102FA653|nr:hypothetical protein [Rhizobium ruizarguesonis]TAT69986.1 hypothetical protein ELI52_38595 [Rhizobium ruizarguesonis]